MSARSNARHLVSLACGLVFGAGLVVSGMTDPAKVQAFLDVRGAWDPSMAFVMGSAVVTCAALYAIARRRTPKAFPTNTTIDARLVSGAAIFGVGWGLVGACPGPAVVALGSGAVWSIVFVLAMAAGTRLEGVLHKRRAEAPGAQSSSDRAPWADARADQQPPHARVV